MPLLGRRFVAELIGTFTLVFFGCAAVITNAYPGANFGLLGIAWVHAIALAIGVTMTMNISGGHCNPAVSAGLGAAGPAWAFASALDLADAFLAATAIHHSLYCLFTDIPRMQSPGFRRR